MKVKSILPGLYIVPGLVNVYLLSEADGYVLIDSGFPKAAQKILQVQQWLAPESEKSGE